MSKVLHRSTSWGFALLLGLPFGLSAGAAAEDSPLIEEMTVTAQRRLQTETEVPMSIAAFSGDDLERNDIKRISDMQRLVPGFTLAYAGAHAQPNIRGVGTQVAGPGLPTNVAIYVDGVYRPNANINDFVLEDIASVQILKGPQGTLYGKNATGGAVLVTTRDPSERPEANLTVSYRDLEEEQYNGYVAFPMSDSLSASLSAFGKRSDGWEHNIVPGLPDEEIKNWGARAKVLFTPTPEITFKLAAEYIDIQDNYTFAFTNYENVTSAALIPGAITTGKPRKYSNDYRPTFEAQSKGLFLTGEFQLPWGTLTSITAGEWQDKTSGYDVDGSDQPLLHVLFPGKFRTASQSFDFSSNTGDRFDWVAGVFLFKDHGEGNLWIPNFGNLRTLDGEIDTKSFAVYLDGTYHFTPKLHLTLGARYSQDDLEVTFDPPTHPPGLKNDTNFDDVTPRMTLRYDLSDRSSVYASYTEGYKSGGFNVYGVSTTPVGPEEIKAYEIGYKTAFDTWELQTAAFYYDYSDLQVSQYIGSASVLINAAQAEIKGAELQVSTTPLPGLRLDLGLSYTDGEYKKFPGAPHYVWDPAIGASVFPDDASGNPVVNSPEFSGRLGVNYTYPTSNGSLIVSGNYSYQSTAYFDAFKETEQDSYGLVHLSIGWESADQTWALRGFVENATDEDYATSIFQQPTTWSASYAPPRVYGLEFQLSYGG